MELNELLASGKRLKRLNQVSENNVWRDEDLPADTWVEVLSLGGAHWVDMLAARGTNSRVSYAKYEVDGVESVEREIKDQRMVMVIGSGFGSYTYGNMDMDGPMYVENSFKFFIKKGSDAHYGMGMEARYSQVSVEGLK